MFKSDKLIVDTNIPKNFKDFIWFAIRPYKKSLILFFVLSFLGVASWAASPFFVKKLIDTLADQGKVTNATWIFVGFYVLLKLTDEWFWRVAEHVMRGVKPLIVEGARTSLFAAMTEKSHSYFVSNSSGRVGHWINQAANTLNNFGDTTIWSVWPRSVGLLLASVFLLFTHWSIALLFVVWLVVLFKYTITRGREYSKLIAKKSNAESAVAGRIVDSVSNNVSVRVFNGRTQEIDSVKSYQDKTLYFWDKEWRYHWITNAVKGHSTAIVSGLALSLMLVLYSKSIITVGDVVLFFAYFMDASSSLWELSWQMDQYYNQSGTINNSLSKLLKSENERVVEEFNVEYPNSVEVRLDNVSFAYSEQPKERVLNSINLVIEKGQKVGVVGHSGAGKSTLVGLLLGFFDPTKGSILINGEDTFLKSPSFVRAISSYVPQDTSLFNRTIRDNISYAKPGSSDEHLLEALEQAQARDFVEKMPEGLDTLIGERGVKLSGGQRQRIAIARAMLKDAPFLILDEATSALDSVSEQAIQKALHKLMKGRTALVIAHRLSTLKHLDKIVVVEKGKIIEEGTHDELVVRKGGVYADLWRRQKDGFIVE